ncbi:DNA-binding transcriptional LysR family regulator [Acinetobacter baylyi]|uniref:DNA-binding transcriptional LysR family regulator n=1 Tax=Acinetobacter baylyi TaxID=202950 RepID=A0ABU0UUS6_ACIBI|nr:LysR family transcriptional regulator [Acinetobacter baylyi]MDQ1208294.1 DNA-binding transcriptional LysR family regulator [Acinetobacter baylyi]MDR6108116.1 DNA-binding transcriptional LysR family regulator [Acinetobacter baylyi]MDR6185166.1 DNA-binding transcriptional LysR family regulator [Acinetobacter baylyi]
MTLTQLEIFSVVVERQGFSTAAAQLKISQSAVSHAIKALEDELGVTLLNRQTGSVELTDIGMCLIQRSRMILGLAETMRQEAADARGMKRGTLRIGSFGPTSSMQLLPNILKEYRKLYPNIEVHVSEGPDNQVVQWIMDRKVDVGFVTLPEDQFDTYPLIEDQMVVLLPEGHSLTSKNTIVLEELCNDPFILTEAGSGELVSRLFLAKKLQPNIRYRTSQLMSTFATVSRGDAITIVAESALPDISPFPYIKKKLHPPIKRNVALAVPDERQSSPATKAFILLAQRTLKIKTA